MVERRKWYLGSCCSGRALSRGLDWGEQKFVLERTKRKEAREGERGWKGEKCRVARSEDGTRLATVEVGYEVSQSMYVTEQAVLLLHCGCYGNARRNRDVLASLCCGGNMSCVHEKFSDHRSFCWV